MKKVSTNQKWRNIVNYVYACRDVMDDKPIEEQLMLENEMYKWLEENYQINWNQKTLKKLSENHPIKR